MLTPLITVHQEHSVSSFAPEADLQAPTSHTPQSPRANRMTTRDRTSGAGARLDQAPHSQTGLARTGPLEEGRVLGLDLDKLLAERQAGALRVAVQDPVHPRPHICRVVEVHIAATRGALGAQRREFGELD